MWIINSLYSQLLDRASFPHYNHTQDHQIWLRTYHCMSNYLWAVIFAGFARNPEYYCRQSITDKLMANPESEIFHKMYSLHSLKCWMILMVIIQWRNFALSSTVYMYYSVDQMFKVILLYTNVPYIHTCSHLGIMKCYDNYLWNNNYRFDYKNIHDNTPESVKE